MTERRAELEVSSAAAQDVPALAVAMAHAFAEDPVMSWLLPDGHRRHERLRRFFELELRLVGLRNGRVLTTARRDAALIVTEPGRWRLPWAVTLRNGLAFTRAFGARLPLAASLLQAMEHRHLRDPHYYIPYVGVTPAAQGGGVGTGLMKRALLRCDRDGVPAYLEATSPRNAALYERLGFVGLSELRFAGSPPLYLMRRPPDDPTAQESWPGAVPV